MNQAPAILNLRIPGKILDENNKEVEFTAKTIINLLCETPALYYKLGESLIIDGITNGAMYHMVHAYILEIRKNAVLVSNLNNCINIGKDVPETFIPIEHIRFQSYRSGQIKGGTTFLSFGISEELYIERGWTPVGGKNIAQNLATTTEGIEPIIVIENEQN